MKNKLLILLLIILIASLCIIPAVNAAQRDNQASKDTMPSKIIIFSIILLLFIFIAYKFKLIAKILNLYNLDLNGMIMLQLDFHVNNPQVIAGYQEFKTEFSQFQSKYDFLEYDLDYGEKFINIEVKAPQKLMIKDGEQVLNNFVDDLDQMMKVLPENNILIDVNITGVTTNLLEKIKFVISNRHKEVGINQNRYKKGVLANLFYVKQ